MPPPCVGHRYDPKADPLYRDFDLMARGEAEEGGKGWATAVAAAAAPVPSQQLAASQTGRWCRPHPPTHFSSKSRHLTLESSAACAAADEQIDDDIAIEGGAAQLAV